MKGAAPGGTAVLRSYRYGFVPVIWATRSAGIASSPDRPPFRFPFRPPFERCTPTNHGARRVVPPHVATTSRKKKPLPMLVPPARVTVADAVPPASIVSVPGATETQEPELAVTLREQLSPPPVSSWNATDIAPFTGLPPVQTPKLTDAGDSVAGVFVADSTLIRPPPRDNGLDSGAPVMGLFTGRSAVFTRADFTSAEDHPEWAANNNAAAPAVCGVAIDVPEKNAYDGSYVPSGLMANTLESTFTPGAVTSGLMRNVYGVGPRLENPARKSAFEVTTSEIVVPSTVIWAPSCAFRIAPSVMETIAAGIVGKWTPSAPIETGWPNTLFTMIAPIAPASSAFWIFVPNVQIPRLMTAILPSTSFVIAAHPSAGVAFAVFPVIAGT